MSVELATLRKTMNWQPIETSPKDRTRFLVTNGEIFAGATWEISYREPATLRRTLRCVTCPHHHNYVEDYPNPAAGQPVYKLEIGNPIGFECGFEPSPSWDGGNFEDWNPTHWAPMIEPPHSRPIEEQRSCDERTAENSASA